MRIDLIFYTILQKDFFILHRYLMLTKVISSRLLAGFFISLQSSVAVAQIVTDGSVGVAGNLGVSRTLTDGLAADHVVIGEELGTLVGKNLFHSFKEFNIQTNGSATFTGYTTPHSAIGNVIIAGSREQMRQTSTGRCARRSTAPICTF